MLALPLPVPLLLLQLRHLHVKVPRLLPLLGPHAPELYDFGNARKFLLFLPPQFHQPQHLFLGLLNEDALISSRLFDLLLAAGTGKVALLFPELAVKSVPELRGLGVRD